MSGYEQTCVFPALPRTQRATAFTLGGDPKGKNILYCFGQSVVIRDLENPAIADVYTQHVAKTTVAKYAPSGFYIASADESGKVRIWDTTQKEHILKYEYQPIAGAIKDIAWSPDSKRIAICGDGKEKFAHCFLWDTGSSVGELVGISKVANSIDYRATRPFRIITGGDDNTTTFYEGPPFKFKMSLAEHTRFVNCVRFSPNGERFVTVGADGKGFIYDGKTAELIGELGGGKAHDGGIYGCSWSPDSNQLITCSGDKTVKLWDMEQNSVVSTFVMGKDIEDQQLSCLWQGDYLLSVSLNGYINYLDKSNPSSPIRIVKGHNQPISSMALSEDKCTVYTADNSGRITHWDTSTGAHDVICGKGHKNKVSGMGVQGGNLITCSMDDSVRYTHVPGTEYGPDAVTMDSQPQGVGLGKDGLSVVACTNEVVVVRNGRKMFSLPVDFEVTAAGIHPNQTQVVVGGKADKKLHVYNLAGDTLVDCKTVPLKDAVTAFAFSPDGRYLSCAQTSRHITTLDVTAGYEIIQNLDAWMQNAKVTCLAWNPSSTHLASGSLDTNIIIWTLAKPFDRFELKGAHPMSQIVGVDWLSDHKLISVGIDNSIREWDIKL
ncbi:PREDICTED: WD repeat-containing protein 1-B-like [Branchiostoma belcheri]|uniref:Actin-interacting protein 1 n=1 Tax=Branchiostoma belcheri TaxID=7741 RepID=A0A6P4Y9Z2_BRABE|nr:PREDICTED: WD repeat-containing protein 1-B-like [Branchiostoma belcheri]